METNLTCLTCGVRFRVSKGDNELANDENYKLAIAEHKAHLKSDWHRYNLKRKVLELPAVTEEAFTEKVLQQRAQQNEAVAFSGHCELCNKTFASSNAFENHVKSKKHKDLELKTNTKIEIRNNLLEGEALAGQSGNPIQKSTDQDQPDANGDEEKMTEELSGSEEDLDGEGLGLEECLFCSKVSKTMEKNITHMTLVHGFFIPDLEYVCDLEGLMTYLGELVGELHLCLWCKAQRFRDVQAAKQHMVDKGHCKMLHEGDAILEYSDFYDYRKSYPDYDVDDGAAKDDDEDEEVRPDVLEQSGFQLVLPSGSTVGHRALMRYFQQKLRPERQITIHRDTSALSKVVAHYKALGWTGTVGMAAAKKAKDIAYVNQLQARHYMQLGVKSNRLQKHYRDQNFGF